MKAQVLVAGYPTSGYGYDTYLDNVGSLTTESERNQLTLYGLQDRLAAVIRNFEGVQDAVVFLTPGEDNTYVLDSGNVVDATAAVQVTMQSGRTLDDNQVDAIRNLVSRALSGLNVENVEISDSYGNTYSGSGNLTDLRDASSLKLALEEQCNNNIRTRIMQALLPIYGSDNVQVSVNTVVDVDRTYTDSTDYAAACPGPRPTPMYIQTWKTRWTPTATRPCTPPRARPTGWSTPPNSRWSMWPDISAM